MILRIWNILIIIIEIYTNVGKWAYNYWIQIVFQLAAWSWFNKSLKYEFVLLALTD